jgi:uncharacterized repeat protein (TIGR01451 family)
MEGTMKTTMKYVLFLALMMIAGSGSAALKQHAITLKYKNFSLAFVHHVQGEAKLLPLIDGVAGKERFGIHFANADRSAPMVEILDGGDGVVKSLSVNDILSKRVEVLPSSSRKPRRVSWSYSVQLPKGEAQLVLKAIATGDELSGDQQLVVTFALKANSSVTAGLRVNLPYAGIAEVVGNGFLVTSKSGGAAIVASAFPHAANVKLEKGKLTIVSGIKTPSPFVETAMVWLVFKGVSSSSPTDVKSQARKAIQENALAGDEPKLVVVNTADKEQLTQSDTASYTLVCANIGTGEATDVVLGNPIPRGARYVEGSATTDGAVFGVDRGTADEQNLRWMLSAPLKPGEERIVSFKVVLR